MTKHDKELLNVITKARDNRSLDEFRSWLRGFMQPGPEFSDALKNEVRKLAKEDK